MHPSDKTEKVKVWPEMVLRETIATLVALILLLLAAMYIQAPLEGIADPSFSMNPSKAPWYFLGLQEMLVYFTPWVAGVAIPLVVILVLMAIPYLDISVKTTTGVVYRSAKGISTVFSTGLMLWVTLTIIGLFFRGPNWALQWPGGSPLGGGYAVLSMDGLIPLVIGIYLLVLLTRQRKEVPHENNNSTLWHRCFFHLLGMGGLAIIVKIFFSLLVALII